MKPRYTILPMILAMLLLACLIAIALLGCEKDLGETHCYQCVKSAFQLNTTTFEFQCFPNDTVNRCGWTERDAAEFEERFNNVWLRGTCGDILVRQDCFCVIVDEKLNINQ